MAIYPFMYIAFLILMPHSGHLGDMECWANWAWYIKQNGLGNIYFSGTDYPPLYHYFLTFFASLKGNEISIRGNIYELKYITLLFEFISIFLLFKFINKEDRIFFFIFIMLNPAFFYNNIMWGQVDGILSCLLLGCFLLLINRKNTLGLLLYVLALNFKLQSIIYFPLIFFILLYNIADFKGLKYSLFVLLSIATLQLTIITPFIYSGSTSQLLDVIINSVDKYPVTSMNAYNCWFWFFDEHPIGVFDTGTFLHITYKSWGLLFFFVSSVLALLPLFLICISNLFEKNIGAIKNLNVVFASAALVSVLFFFFNTQMHERYSHYALIFLAGYFAVTKNYFPFLLASCAYFLNMEDVLWALNFPNYDIVILNPVFISVIYCNLIIVLYYLIYKNSDFLINSKNISYFLRSKFHKNNSLLNPGIN